MIEIRLIDQVHSQDINIKNEPFTLWGCMIPSYIDGKWSFTSQEYSRNDVREMCFPDENYIYETMSENSIFIGAYDGDQCIGLAILQKGFFQYMYLYDLKVNKSYRKKGISNQMILKAKEIAVEKGYRGIYAICQDNNLSACLFYVKTGFRIGGFDSEVYKGTNQEGKSDLMFYLDALEIY